MSDHKSAPLPPNNELHEILNDVMVGKPHTTKLDRIELAKARLTTYISKQIAAARIDELEWHRSLAKERYDADNTRKDAPTTIRVIDDRIAELQEETK